MGGEGDDSEGEDGMGDGVEGDDVGGDNVEDVAGDKEVVEGFERRELMVRVAVLYWSVDVFVCWYRLVFLTVVLLYGDFLMLKREAIERKENKC